MPSFVAKKLNQTLAQEYPNVGDLVKTVMNYQVFFNRNIIKENKLDFAKIKQSVVDVLAGISTCQCSIPFCFFHLLWMLP